MSQKFVDSIDYMADTIEVAPDYEWRVMEINIARVSKIVPRYCQPTCPDYRKDHDQVCLKVDKDVDECTSFIFDMHKVERGEKVLDVMFGTSTLNPHQGYAWRVGESYLRYLLGDKRVDKMISDFIKLKTPPKDGFKLR
jgi:hypothetical protein